MRVAFTVTLLILAALYTWSAFSDLTFLSSTGRLGPGFFPRIVGVSLVVACLIDLAIELFRPRPPVAHFDHIPTVLAVAGLSVLFVLALAILGGYLAMFAFVFATLTVLDRTRPVQSLAIALILPSAIYLLFDVWLNAAVPRGMLFDVWLA
jgi:hypothetical protein